MLYKTLRMTVINVILRCVEGIGTSKYIYRQGLATFAASLLSLSGGITFGFTAVLLPQLEDDKTFPYDKSYDSWIASISPLAMMMGCLFSGTMSDALGRKFGQMLLVIPFSVGWIVMGVANNNVIMLLGRFITGICTGAIRPLTMVYIGELTTPKYRAITLFCPSLALPVGSFISHTVGKYIYWKTSCFIFILPNVICVLILLFLKESPLWLITKRRIDEGIESFKSFRGDGEESQKELKAVLDTFKEKTKKSSFKDILNIIFCKPFFKSLATILLLFIAVQWCGINTLSFYAQEVFQKTFSGDVDAFLLMLATDCIRAISALVVCIFAKHLPRKITFVTCCYSTTILLICLVIYLYLNPVGLVGLAVTLLILYMAIASVLTCISWSFVAEIFPAEVRGFGSGLSSGMSFALLFTSVKATPSIMATFGEPVMYACFAGITLLAAVFLTFILPETNGKSLQDIENSLYKNCNNKNIDMNAISSSKPQQMA